MTKEQIRKKIKAKFGSLSNFAEISGIPRYDIQKAFARKVPDKKFMALLEMKCNVLRPRPVDGEITPSDRKKLERALNEAGGVIEFTRKNPDFSKDSIFQILSGKRKRMTEKVKELFSHFELVT